MLKRGVEGEKSLYKGQRRFEVNTQEQYRMWDEIGSNHPGAEHPENELTQKGGVR